MIGDPESLKTPVLTVAPVAVMNTPFRVGDDVVVLTPVAVPEPVAVTVTLVMVLDDLENLIPVLDVPPVAAATTFVIVEDVILELNAELAWMRIAWFALLSEAVALTSVIVGAEFSDLMPLVEVASPVAVTVTLLISGAPKLV